MHAVDDSISATSRSVLQCVAVRCSVLQCVAVCCSDIVCGISTSAEGRRVFQ